MKITKKVTLAIAIAAVLAGCSERESDDPVPVNPCLDPITGLDISRGDVDGDGDIDVDLNGDCRPDIDNNNDGVIDTPPPEVNAAVGYYSGTINITRTTEAGTSFSSSDIEGAIPAAPSSVRETGNAIFVSADENSIYSGPIAATGDGDTTVNSTLRRYFLNDITQFSFAGAYTVLGSGSFAGTLTARSNIDISRDAGEGGTDEIQLTYDSNTTSPLGGSSLAKVVGTYLGSDPGPTADPSDDRSAQITVASDGALSGTTSEGCTFSGRVAAPPSESINVHTLSGLTFSCPSVAPKSLNGALVKLSDSQVWIGLANNSNAYVYILNK